MAIACLRLVTLPPLPPLPLLSLPFLRRRMAFSTSLLAPFEYLRAMEDSSVECRRAVSPARESRNVRALHSFRAENRNSRIARREPASHDAVSLTDRIEE